MWKNLRRNIGCVGGQHEGASDSGGKEWHNGCLLTYNYMVIKSHVKSKTNKRESMSIKKSLGMNTFYLNLNMYWALKWSSNYNPILTNQNIFMEESLKLTKYH